MNIYYYSVKARALKHRTVSPCAYLGYWLALGLQYLPLVAVASTFYHTFYPAYCSPLLRIPAIAILSSAQHDILVFCDGWMLGLFVNDNNGWKAVSTCCLIYICAATIYTAYVLLYPLFPAYWFLWGAGAYWIGCFIYDRYRFMKDEVLPISSGFYRAGLWFGGWNTY